MKNQVDVINGLSESDGVAHYLNSSLNKSAIEKVKSDILSGKTKLLYVAPESLTKEDNVEFLKTIKISFYAVDEAHCISEWGHDFRPEYRRIRPIVNEIGQAPVIALTATATDKVRTDIKKNLGILDALEYKSSFNRPNLYYEVRQKTNDVDRQIIKFIRQHPGKSGIIYCLSRKKVEELAEILKANDIKAAPYHAGLDSATRSQTQDDFLMEKIDVIVATIAFGMGIDKPDVRFVIHYDIPKSLAQILQHTIQYRIERTGYGIMWFFYIIILELLISNNHERLRIVDEALAGCCQFQKSVILYILSEETGYQCLTDDRIPQLGIHILTGTEFFQFIMLMRYDIIRTSTFHEINNIFLSEILLHCLDSLQDNHQIIHCLHL